MSYLFGQQFNPLKPFINTDQNLRELLLHGGWLPAKVASGKCVGTCVVAGIHFPSFSQHTTKLSQVSTLTFSVRNNKVTLTGAQRSLKQCSCSSRLSHSATWRVSARCLAFCIISGLAISSKHADTNTPQSGSSPQKLTNCLYTSQITGRTFHHRLDIMLGGVIPAPQRVFV